MRHTHRALPAFTLTLISTSLFATSARAEVHDAAEIIHAVVYMAAATLPFLVLLGFGIWLLIASLRARREAMAPTAREPERPRVLAMMEHLYEGAPLQAERERG